MNLNNKKNIVAIRKVDGKIEQVKFDSGEVVSIDEAIQLAEKDLINNVNTGATRGDHPHKTLRSNPDGDVSNNLDNLPSF